MSCYRLRQSTLRGALAATAVLAAIGMAAVPAGADPSGSAPTSGASPAPTGTPLQQYEQLAQQASNLNNQLQTAQASQAADQAQLATANADLATAQAAHAAAQAKEDQFRGQVDSLTDASYEGAQFGQLSVLMSGGSASDYLTKATLLQDLADTNDTALQQLQDATNAAAAAKARADGDRQTAQHASDAAAALVGQISNQEQALGPLVDQARAAAGKLPTSALSGGGVSPAGFMVPAGPAGDAMRWAMSQIGKPYVWGAAGSASYDCSGLVLWSWAHEGVSLPHSAQAQSERGTLVSKADLTAGDLVFFGGGPSDVHHVGIYVGGGYFVNAPDTGEDVRIQLLDNDFVLGRSYSP